MKTIYNTVNRTQMHDLVKMVIESFNDVGQDLEEVSKEMFNEAVLMLCEDVAGLEMLDDDDVTELTRELIVIFLNR